MKSFFQTQRRGFTLVEMMVTLAVVTLVGGLVFLILNSGMTLYAKNTAVNAAHQQARSGVDEMLTNIHSSVSIPQLMQVVGTALVALPPPGTGPAAAINFQRFDGGPFQITADVNPGDIEIKVNSGAYAPKELMRFNVPSHDFEQPITKSTTKRRSGGIWSIDFDAPLDCKIKASSRLITGFTTYRTSYAVIGTELRYYPFTSENVNDVSTYKVIARNVTSSLPFLILLNADGGVDNRSVAAVKLATKEPQYSNRGYAAVNMFINSYIPFRSQLTKNQ